MTYDESDDDFEEESSERSKSSPAEPIRGQTPLVSTKPLDLDELLQCGVSRNDIRKMKEAKLDKPAFIPWGDWNGPKSLSPKQLFVCYLAAKGHSQQEIAAETGFAQSRLSILLQSEAMRNQIQLIRDVEFKGLGTQQAVDSLASSAARVIQKALVADNTPIRVRVQAAQDVLDRKLGRAQQRVEHSGSMIKDIYALMNDEFAASALPASKAIEVESSPAEKEIPEESSNTAPQRESEFPGEEKLTDETSSLGSEALSSSKKASQSDSEKSDSGRTQERLSFEKFFEESDF